MSNDITESGDYVTIVCVRVSDLHIPSYGSIQSICSSCGNMVWIGLSGQKQRQECFRKGILVSIICSQCIESHITGDDIYVSDETAEEISRQLGKKYTASELEAVIKEELEL